MDSEQQISARWEELVNEGILTPDSVDEDQEVVYIIDAEKLAAYDALLYQAYQEDMDVYIAGLVGRDELELLLGDDGEFYFVPKDDQVGWLAK